MLSSALTMKKLALSLFCVALLAAPANAVNRDEFAHVTPGNRPQSGAAIKEAAAEKPLQGAMAMMSPRTPVVQWFESFDSFVASFSQTKADKVILGRSFNQEAERVQQWTQIASKVAKNYRLLATMLRQMEVPPSSPGVQQYRNLTADWYDDSARVFEDLIRPRKAARTMEELEDQLAEVEGRAKGLKQTSVDLHAMDQDLRQKYHVHASREDDALTKYVMGK